MRYLTFIIICAALISCGSPREILEDRIMVKDPHCTFIVICGDEGIIVDTLKGIDTAGVYDVTISIKRVK